MVFYFMRASKRQKVPVITLEGHKLSFQNVGVCVLSACAYPTNAAGIDASSMVLFEKVRNIKHLNNLIGASYE